MVKKILENILCLLLCIGGVVSAFFYGMFAIHDYTVSKLDFAGDIAWSFIDLTVAAAIIYFMFINKAHKRKEITGMTEDEKKIVEKSDNFSTQGEDMGHYSIQYAVESWAENYENNTGKKADINEIIDIDCSKSVSVSYDEDDVLDPLLTTWDEHCMYDQTDYI